MQVAATFMSPAISTALTAEPGTSGPGSCASGSAEPMPLTGVTPASANCGANRRSVSSLNPLNTIGVSIGVR